MMFGGCVEPFRDREWKLQFATGCFESDFESANSADAKDRSFIDNLQGRSTETSVAARKPKERASIENHRAAFGHSSSVAGSTGSYLILILLRTGCFLMREARRTGTSSATGVPFRQMVNDAFDFSTFRSRLEKFVLASWTFTDFMRHG